MSHGNVNIPLCWDAFLVFAIASDYRVDVCEEVGGILKGDGGY